MKTRKELNKSETKTKTNETIALKSRPKVKQNVTSSERLCNRCRNHDIISQFREHKCPYSQCPCLKCRDFSEKARRRAEMAQKRRRQKSGLKDNKPSKVAKEGPKTPKTDSNSFAKTLRNKSKKLLNKKKSLSKIAKQSVNERNGSGDVQQINQNDCQLVALNQQSDEEFDFNDNPPELMPQSSRLAITNNADTNGLAPDLNGSNNNTVVEANQTFKSSASLCGQYLKSSGILAQKLQKIELSAEEMMACLTYSTLRDCLGDVDMAVQKITIASQEIRCGAAYNMQHPIQESKEEQNTETNGQQTVVVQTGVVPNLPMLCSTFNPNFQPNYAINYSPSCTPIHPNRN